MPRSSGTGPTGMNRISLGAALVRYWRAELGCSEDELRHAIAAVGAHAGDVRRYLERHRRTQQMTAQRQMQR